MTDILALKILKFKLTHSREDFDLISELEHQIEVKNHLLGIASHTEYHLKSAEKALIEKDDTIEELQKKISILKKALNKRDSQIGRLSLKCSEQSETICKDAERIKVLETELDTLHHYTEDLEAQYNAKLNHICNLETEIGTLKAQLQDSIGSITATAWRVQIAKYESALKDLRGSLQARADHDQELVAALDEILQ